MEQPIITFKNFSFRYDSQSEPTLRDINVNIYPDEKILILGPSGSGKSTFGKCLNGLIPEAYPGEFRGELTIKGHNLIGKSIGQLSYQVGTVLQDTSAQFVGLTVAEDVAFSLENDAIHRRQMRHAVHEWMQIMELETLAQQSPQALSGGQKQRVSMAGVLIDQPDILLFDEPLANLDPASGYETMALIHQMQKDYQTTVIIIEHRLEDVLSQPVDRILLFDQGRIVYDGSPELLLKSNLLDQMGIREPLYVSALKYAGVPIEEIQAIDYLEQVSHPQMADQLRVWNATQSYDDKFQTRDQMLRLHDISFKYPFNQKQVLNHLSLDIHKGQMISIVGTNGAGKTTLAKLIAGFIQPDSGSMHWYGQDLLEQSIQERAQRIGYVMQDPNQMISQHLIYDEVALGLRLRGMEENEIRDRAHHALLICGLYPFREWPISALSFGQKKRVTIAAILVLQPQLLILDEPTAGQDFKHYREFMQFIQSLNEQGMTIMMITHDLQLMLEYTDRCLVITDGKLLADTTPFAVLTSESLTKEASLRPTSLYSLANKVGIDDATEFVRNFIQYDREVNHYE